MNTPSFLKETKTVEVDIHPISKWKRMLLYLGDMFISFIAAVFLMNVLVMPVCSAITKPNTEKAIAAEHKRDEILYENKILFFKEESTNFPKYDLDANLKYTSNRFIAYYVFDSDQSLDPYYPEYSHISDNEVFWTYYHRIRSDDLTYYDLFEKHNKEANLFVIEGTNISLKEEVINEIKVYFKPGETLGSKGQTYFDQLNELFSALYGCVTKDIYEKDLYDSAGNSFKINQQIVTEINENYYTVMAICSSISFVLAWAIVRIVYPLINKSNHTPTMSIMKVDRLGYRNLLPLSKGETVLTSAYYLAFDLPYIMFVPLSFITMIYALKIPVLPILSLMSLLLVVCSLIIILVNSFNRSAVDIFSQSVLIPSEEVDGIIKTKEMIQEAKIANKRKEQNA